MIDFSLVLSSVAASFTTDSSGWIFIYISIFLWWSCSNF